MNSMYRTPYDKKRPEGHTTLRNDGNRHTVVGCRRMDVLHRLREMLQDMDDEIYYPSPKLAVRSGKCYCNEPPPPYRDYYDAQTLDGQEARPNPGPIRGSRGLIRWIPNYNRPRPPMDPSMHCYCCPPVCGPRDYAAYGSGRIVYPQQYNNGDYFVKTCYDENGNEYQVLCRKRPHTSPYTGYGVQCC